MSQATKDKLREVHLGRKTSEETKEKMRGRTPWNKGKALGPLTDECKRKLSEKLSGREFSDSHRESISKALTGKPGSAKGRIHITDGKTSKMVAADESIPEGWYRGRAPFKKSKG